MKIYFAGSGYNIEREILLNRLKTNRLFSFVWHGEEGILHNEFLYRIKALKGENKIKDEK